MFTIRVAHDHVFVDGPTGSVGDITPLDGPLAEASAVNCVIQNIINTALIRIEQYCNDNKLPLNEDQTELHITREQAIDIACCEEYRTYLRCTPDALQCLVDDYNPNRKYQLTTRIYGVLLKVEGCRYPPRELVELVREVDEHISATLRKFRKESVRILFEGSADEQPIVVCRGG